MNKKEKIPPENQIVNEVCKFYGINPDNIENFKKVYSGIRERERKALVMRGTFRIILN